jgi:integrase
LRQGKTPCLKTFLKEYLSSKNYRAATAILYETLFDQFNSVFKSIKASEFDLNVWNRFKLHLRKTRSANTVCIRLAKLKATVKFLRVQGYTIPVEAFPMPKEEIKKVALDFDSFEKIVAFQPPTEALQRIKDLCLFQCYTGLRISDLMKLGRQHIKNENGVHFISMNAYKTNKALVIPLREAFEILCKYDFRLPILREQYYNRELKRLLILADADRLIEWEAYDENGKKIFKKELLSKNFSNHCCSRTAINYFFN